MFDCVSVLGFDGVAMLSEGSTVSDCVVRRGVISLGVFTLLLCDCVVLGKVLFDCVTMLFDCVVVLMVFDCAGSCNVLFDWVFVAEVL